jgi:membrane protease YdiL (CAAX protease family)
MDSLSQSEQAQPDGSEHETPEAGLTPITTDGAAPDAPLSHGPQLQWIDWSVRLLACALAVAALTSQLITRIPNNDGTLSLVILAGLVGIYLLGSIEPVARRLYAWAKSNPVGMAFPPLLLLIADVLTAALLLFLPVALALTNSPRLRWGDISLGLVTVAMPLVAPILRSANDIAAMDGLLRAGAFALPLALLALTTRRQKERLNFLFLCAVLALWYSIEFNAFPGFILPGQSADMYFHLVAICTFLYVLAIAGRFGGLGLSLKPSPHGLSIVASNLAIFTLIAIPIGLITGFIKPGLASSSLGEALGRAFVIYLTIALPEEILFRGTLLSYLNDTLRWPQVQTIALSALVFGASHLNNPPNAGWYFVLATVAGVFYARTYLATKNVAAAATLHTAVDWLWAMVFAR